MEERKETKPPLSGPRFLIVRFSAIGDCVMAAWAATAIRNRHPDAFICWAVEERCAPVVDTKHLVDHVVEIPRKQWRGRGLSAQVLREQVAICNGLRKLKFDFGFDLQGHLKTGLCLRFAFPKSRAAVRATDPFTRLLNPVPGLMPSDTHWIDWHLKVMQTFGDFKVPDRPLMPPRPKKRNRLVTISTSAGHPSKVYPADKWRTVAHGLQQDGFEIAFLGAEGDPKVELHGAIDHVGKLSLGESMRLVASSELHLAGDTGTGHMAAAYDVPVVSIFGHMEPANFRPYTSKGIVLRKGTEASNVDAEEVLASARALAARCRN
jgi:ADP-heptose:LPS heptosyltransferase